ncbi:MAG: hypothetical protein WA790_17230 [Sulfitobacter sp.]
MFKYLFLPKDTPIAIPPEFSRFKCLILIERDVNDSYRNDVSDTLVKNGCLYMMAWGLDCSLWDDSVDWAFLALYEYGAYPEDQFVMTTWHENDTLQEMLEFAKVCSDHSDVDLQDILVLDFGSHERGGFIEQSYRHA